MDYAKTTGKDGVSVISDMDSFYYSQKGDLLQYEMTLPKVLEGMDFKGMCTRHMRGFGRVWFVGTFLWLVGSPTPYTKEFVSVNLLLLLLFSTDK
jgi:hypothetical protein